MVSELCQKHHIYETLVFWIVQCSTEMMLMIILHDDELLDISKFHFHQQFGYSTTSSHASYTVENNTIPLNNRDTCTQFFNFSQLKLSSTVIVVVVLLKVVRKMATINPEIDLWNKSSADPEW